MRLYFQCKRLCAHWGEVHININDYYYNYYSKIIIIILGASEWHSLAPTATTYHWPSFWQRKIANAVGGAVLLEDDRLCVCVCVCVCVVSFEMNVHCILRAKVFPPTASQVHQIPFLSSLLVPYLSAWVHTCHRCFDSEVSRHFVLSNYT